VKGGGGMPEDIKVKPTPIQRNTLDVATELTQLYFSRYNPDTPEEIQEVFLKFYAVAEAADNINYRYLKAYLPKEINKIIE
jgi:hypothetical protein